MTYDHRASIPSETPERGNGTVRPDALELFRRWLGSVASAPDFARRAAGKRLAVKWTVGGEPYRVAVDDGTLTVGPWPTEGTQAPDLELACDREALADLAEGKIHFFLSLWATGRILLGSGSWGDAYRLGYVLSEDGRSRRVVFVAHCWLNINTRFPGGGSHAGPNPDVLRLLEETGCGIVQMPCPEQRVFGLDKHLFGTRPAEEVRRALAGLAAGVIDDVVEYRLNGYEVVAIVGMDPSPTCGVRAAKGKGALLGLDQGTAERPGPGAFIEALLGVASERGVTLPPVVGLRRVLSPAEGAPPGFEELRELLDRARQGRSCPADPR